MVKERNEIDDYYKWDLESVYESEEEWEEDFERIGELIEEVKQYEGEVAESPENLWNVLQARQNLYRNFRKLGTYAQYKMVEDTRKDEYKGLLSKLEALKSEVSAATNFINEEIRDAGEEQIMDYIEEEERLSEYEESFEHTFRMKEHKLSEEKREILSKLGGALGIEKTTHEQIMNADIDFPEVEKPDGEVVTVTHSNKSKLLKNRDREFRETVYRKYMEEVTRMHNTLAANYENKVKRNVRMAEIKGYNSARHKAMKDIDVPEEVYDLLIETVEDNVDLLHEKSKIRKEVLDIEDIMPWDGNVPLFESNEPELSFEEAKEHVLEGLSPLGDEYVDQLKEGFENGWVDVYPNKGKRSGAFSGGTYDTKPFILMNFEGALSDMYTLAHEGGHSMHKELTKKTQPYEYSNHPIFTAEIASTVNETLLTRHLLENVEDEELHKHLLSRRTSSIAGTLFTQTKFATFEHEAHKAVEEGKPLTPGILDQMYSDISGRYSSKYSKSTEFKGKGWMRIPHFFRPYYVYQYATGISASMEIADQIMEEGEPAAERYLNFLKSGCRKYPLELLEDLGVDMESGEPIEKAVKRYGELVEELDELVE